MIYRGIARLWKPLVALATVSLIALSSMALPAAPRAEAATAPRKISAWLPYWDSRGYQTFLDNADLYADLSPFWYEFSSAGTITKYPGAEDLTVINGAKSKGVAVIPTITNDFDPTRVHTMLASSSARSDHVAAIVNLVASKGYDGFDVDYEGLQASDRDLYSAFITELANALHAQGKMLTVAVHPKTSEPGTWDGPMAQDYVAIGQAADKVRVMAYDYSWATSSAGPVAPLDWVKQVAQFSVSQIPAAKVQLGVPLYGYDWIGSNGTGQMWAELEQTRTTYGAAKQWSTAHSSPWFSYSTGGTDHTVWYEDAQSVDAKLAVVDQYALAGAVFWRIGGEDPAVWTKARGRWGAAPSATTTTTAADSTAPSVPSGLTAKGGYRSASLSWTTSTDTGGSGIAGYDIYRATSSGGTYSKVGSTASASFTNTGLAAGRTYWFYVKARDRAGNASNSSAKVSARAY